MSAFILHHYDGSPFSEKLRLVLGYKILDWLSVKVPVIMPTPTLYPADQPLAPILAQWADSTLFWTVIPYAMQPTGAAVIFKGLPPEVLKAFAADRAPFTATMKRQTPADATVALRGYLAELDAQLADGRSHLLGDAASIADFSVAHCLWYLRRAGSLAGIIPPRLSAWLDRMLAIGHGRCTPVGSSDAVALAATATGTGTGTLVGLSADEVVLARTDARAGTVHVHFPRRGYQIKAETA